jgi:hypothetical protein
MDPDLRRRLRRLGVTQGFTSTSGPAPARDAAAEVIEADAADDAPAGRLPGAEVSTAHGPVWIEERTYPVDHVHGRYRLGDGLPPAAEALELLGVPGLGPRPAFLDTETTGLAGGAGTLVFLTGIGLWEGGALHLHLVFLREPGAELAAMRYIDDLLARASGLVTFNGAGFDLPLLEGRFVLNRLDPCWRAHPHLDLLSVARRLWRDHLPSRALGALETEILQVARTGVDIPSSWIPFLYREYLRTGAPEDMARVFYHNRVDVLSLVSLLAHVARMVVTPDEMALAPGEWVGVGRVYDGVGREDDAVSAWQCALAHEDGPLPERCAARLWRELGVRHKRREAWEAAFAVWDAWAERLPLAVDPLVERAKYYEWTQHDLEAALAETNAALRRASRYPVGARRDATLEELRHRQARLERKLGAEHP